METSAVGGTIVTPGRKRRKFPATALTWLAVTPFAAWAVVRVAGLERGSLPTQIMTATPYAAAGSLVPLLIAAVGRKRAATAVALLATTALGFSVLPRALGRAEATTGRPLKVMTINMLFGRADAATIMELVREFQPDVLSTQELTPGAVTDLDEAGLKELMPYRVLQDEWSAGGSGLYSRHPVEPLWDVMPPVGHQMPAALISLPGGKPVEFIDAHPFPPLGPQVVEWNEAMAAFPSASPDRIRIIAGDFNASLDHAALRGLLARGYKDAADTVGAGLIPTWPANKRVPPIITIDHVLVDERVGVKEVSVRDVPKTDHRAVLAELTVP
ncbi:endonuclease/exonuclease/phosphatase family protein [Nonomuraea angiospora]|uniref:Endonuclease/exonuclease/phosphatase (EEP) superfamily protein YafD n=1 Tax=Nonomuraea angiospora TaxID=46172 RepID=A0ABR9M3K5_9ACTN|nr:endonuclease/exonuclease/phosphatase family protein [Nonomuraea angiospora]MBE1587477.1 endonuclease/exonuclease/phosphatase (EEP) superfamily protein YafD [Nonomuraea angiospora]MDX3109020.1 endonuclease/exonuclease/phosphatase family protein [Nonomuraea angiospora]